MTTPEQLLQELYEIDPGLREHEAELIPLIAQLLERDPAQQPSPAFVKKLRKELQARIAAMGSGAVEYRADYAAPTGIAALFGRFAFAAAGAVAAVVIAVPVTLQYANRDATFTATSPGEEAAMKAGTQNDADGFTQGSPPSPTAPSAGMYARGQGGGGMDASMAGNPVMSLIAPWNPVKYRLEGELPALPTSDVTVLERRLGNVRVPYSSIQNAFEDASIDLSSFDGTTVESITIAQRKPFGYYINVSMPDGSVSINQMWDQWPQPANNCQTEECYRDMQPKIGDVPADAELIRIANAFLSEHDINVSAYGAPVVDNAWRTSYEAAEDKRYAWVPESIRVIYPLIIDGQTVYEAGGEPAGISVQVSIRHDRVSDVWGLTTYSFDREQHDPVTDRATVEEFLSKAGMQTPDAPTVVLSNPTVGYVRLYAYENNVNRDLFVPALIFEVKNVPANIGYFQRAVAVPLSKELLDQATPPIPIDPIPMPRPMDGGPAVDVPVQEPLMIKEEEAPR